MVDPTTKTYVEHAVDQRSPNADRIKITNMKSSFTEVEDSGATLVAGYPTTHYRLQLSYDIEVMIGTIAIRQHVESVIDKWMTTAFDHLIGQYRENANDLKTGNPEVDTLIETEATKFKGLALRERTQIATSAEKKSTNSNVKLPHTRKRTREMVVSKIEEVQVSPNMFAIPVDFSPGYDMCAFCRASCPEKPFFIEAETGIPLKCDFCGIPPSPSCVRWCNTGSHWN